MKLNENVDFYGVFSMKSLDKNGNVIDEYHEKNLIMDKARNNMAKLIGGVTSGPETGQQINRFVIGTLGHTNTDILDQLQVGETDTSKPVTDQTFDSARSNLFSEAISNANNYRIDFDVSGDDDVTISADGQMYEQNSPTGNVENNNTIRRVVVDRTVTYTISIPVDNANLTDPVAYTEAALYAGPDIFSMKTFPARVKEETVSFEISWSIIF